MRRDPVIWLNGAFLPGDAPGIPHTDRGFRYGDGVFDTMPVQAGAPVKAAAHFGRLVRHAAVLEIEIPCNIDALILAAQDLADRNSGTGTGTGSGAGTGILRTVVTRGSGGRGLLPPPSPEPLVMIEALPAPPPEDGPVPAIIAQSVRRNEFSPLSRIKSLNYAENILAAMEAEKAGAREAVMLNTRGRPVCTTIGNLVIETQEGRLVTPPLADGCMDGIFRAGLLERGEAREKSLTLDNLKTARAVYRCNSVRGLQRLAIAAACIPTGD